MYELDFVFRFEYTFQQHFSGTGLHTYRQYRRHILYATVSSHKSMYYLRYAVQSAAFGTNVIDCEGTQ